MTNPRYFISDFVEIQRKSFFELLEKGIIEEFSKRNPITSLKKDVELFFYPEYYKLTIPEYSPRQAIIKSKSYTSKLYVPVQLTYKKSNLIRLKWAYVGNLPLMTKRGHFILNGAARVIVNQIIRSPGIYYQQKFYETFSQKWSQKPETSFKRYYADLICLRGTWLRLEIDKDKNIWAQTKKGPKIPVFWFLIAMGLSERIIFNSILEPNRLVQNLVGTPISDMPPLRGPFSCLQKSILEAETYPEQPLLEKGNLDPGKGTVLIKDISTINKKELKQKNNYCYVKNPPSAWKEIFLLLQKKNYIQNSSLDTTSNSRNEKKGKNLSQKSSELSYPKTRIAFTDPKEYSEAEQGRKWLFSRFMNPRAYDLGKQGRSAVNRKLGLNIDERQLTLTPQDLLFATDYLIKVEKGIKNLDDIDHLKNRRVRTSGELIQIQIGIALVRLEKVIRDKINKTSIQFFVSEKYAQTSPSGASVQREQININKKTADNIIQGSDMLGGTPLRDRTNQADSNLGTDIAPPGGGIPFEKSSSNDTGKKIVKSWEMSPHRSNRNQNVKTLTISSLINNKAFNSAIREFFGTSPLSQFMDQINPLAEITHKRRLSSMGPGGVTRDTATLAIRGIHPTHYGRICPIETPEGKNTGLVNSMTAYARVNPLGMLESPFYKVYKGIVLKTSGMFFLSAEHEEKTKLAASDLLVTPIGFLPNSNIPVRIGENFTKINRNNVEYIGVSPIQMISIATSLIPFLEHDDANRALMGSNMQRQAVPLIRPERPIVGTGLEPRAVSDSGHVVQSKFSGVVTYVSAEKIIVTTLRK